MSLNPKVKEFYLTNVVSVLEITLKSSQLLSV